MIEEGADVVITGRDAAALEDTKTQLVAKGRGRALAVAGDLTEPARISTAIDAALREFGRLDHLIANLGSGRGTLGWNAVDAEWALTFDVNFFAPMALTQAFLPLLRESGGRIINVSSIAGKIAAPFLGAYSASKFALEAASDALRLELRPFGVAVSIVEPGDVRTPIWRRSSETSLRMLDAMSAEDRAQYEGMIRAMIAAAQRAERNAIAPERVAQAIERAFLARRPRARYLVGAGARLRLGVARLPEFVRDELVLAALGMRRGAAPREQAAREPV